MDRLARLASHYTVRTFPANRRRFALRRSMTEPETTVSELRDPRVLFAAERTALAWNRTSLSLMGFGFVIERFGLFLHFVAGQQPGPLQRGGSFWIGMLFIVLGTAAAVGSAVLYVRIVDQLNSDELPARYPVHAATAANVALALSGLLLLGYLFTS
jgi:putative membrane protein